MKKYVLIGFVALAILIVCLLRPRREHLDVQKSDDPQMRLKQAQSKVGQINDRLSVMEAKIEESESKRGESTGEATNALGSSSGKLS
jgi:peptidoglycan hydrolase CwlO-like protein